MCKDFIWRYDLRAERVRGKKYVAGKDRKQIQAIVFTS